ncbi:MAG: penicillin acylase family protein [Pseudomonadota bacterium]
MNKKLVLRAAIGVLGVIGFAALAGYWWLKSTVPDYTRNLQAPALAAVVEIVRDEWGVPNITAENFDDAAYAMGYVQAQDRLWQMEMLRRAVHGRTAEVLGEALLAGDIFYKAIYDLPEIARLSFERLDDETKKTFAAFAEGVNLAIANGEGVSSPEWTLLGIQPEPWTASDVNNWMTIVSETADDGGRELEIAEHEHVLEKDIFDFLYEELPAEFPTLYRDTGGENIDQGQAHGAGDVDANRGTNFFVLSGEKTESGKPILAVDPHLPNHAPSIVYPVVVTLPDDVIAGGAWIGSPAIAFGQNSRIAWGMTHMFADTLDYVVERIDPKNPNAYLTPGGPRPFTYKTVTIDVKGVGERQFRVRRSHRGAVVSDKFLEADENGVAPAGVSDEFAIIEELFGPGHVVVRRQVNAEVGQLTIQSTKNMSLAKNWKEFRDALRDYEWTNNVVYADIDGNIGVQMSARLPLRNQVGGWNGQRLARGWLGEGEWVDFVPFDELATIFNPPKGWIADSNSRAAPPEFPYRVTDSFSPPWRVMRAYEMIEMSDRHSLESVAAIQLDGHSRQARWLFDHLRNIPMTSDQAREAIALLDGWNFYMDQDRPEPLLYSAIELALQERIINPHHESTASPRADVLLLARIIDANHEWCDHPKTAKREDCNDAVNEAILKAINAVSQKHGREFTKWRWGSEHHSVYEAFYSWANLPVFGNWTESSVKVSTGENTLNQGSASRDVEMDNLLYDLQFDADAGATFRMVADLSDLSKSQFISAPGISGNVMSRHFDDQVGPWAKGEYFQMARPSPKRQSVTILTPSTE